MPDFIPNTVWQLSIAVIGVTETVDQKLCVAWSQFLALESSMPENPDGRGAVLSH